MAVNKKDMAAGLASAVALISGAQVAGAADAEPIADVQDWSGFYIGGSVGYHWGDAPVAQDNDYKLDGDIVFGGFAGVNQQYGDFVVGAELGLQSGEGFQGDADNDYNIHYTADAKLKLGMVLGAEDQWLVYGFGGIWGSGFENGDDPHDYAAFGLNYGVGAEMMVTEQFSVGAELMGRSVMDTYEPDDRLPDASYQASLRAAFHF